MAPLARRDSAPFGSSENVWGAVVAVCIVLIVVASIWGSHRRRHRLRQQHAQTFQQAFQPAYPSEAQSPTTHNHAFVYTSAQPPPTANVNIFVHSSRTTQQQQQSYHGLNGPATRPAAPMRRDSDGDPELPPYSPPAYEDPKQPARAHVV